MQSFNFLASKLWLYIKDKRTDIQTTFCGLKNIYFNLAKCNFWDSFSNAKMVLSSMLISKNSGFHFGYFDGERTIEVLDPQRIARN